MGLLFSTEEKREPKPRYNMSDKVATLNIQYCGGWGYKRYFDALVPVIEAEFPGILKLCSYYYYPKNN